MDRTLIVCASHHGVELRTQGSIGILQMHGALLLSSTGIADVALARNDVLTRALEANGSKADVFLLVDDDMVWTLEAASKLVSLARKTGEPWSAAYATHDGHLAATPLDWDASRTDGLRMVGLGFCAVPVQKLAALALGLGTVVGPKGKSVVPFCQSRVVVPQHDRVPRWCSEDYWLCRELGGVRIAPYVAAGHIKKVDLWPDQETLRLLAENQALQSAPPESPESPEAPPPSTTKPETPTSKKKKRSKRNGAAQTRA